jgi:putative ABC transport system permease protein
VRRADVVLLALSALGQHRLRTLLTLLGVFAGTFVLLVSTSIGQGVQDAVLIEFQRFDQLRKIEVSPGFDAPEKTVPPAELEVKGEMSDEKRIRIRHALLRVWSRKNAAKARVPLTLEKMEEVRRLDHVVAVAPSFQELCKSSWNNKSHDVVVAAAAPDNRLLVDRVVAGSFPADSEDGVLVHEFLLYQWGVRDDDEIAHVLGQTLRLENSEVRRPVVPGVWFLGSIFSAQEQEALLRLGPHIKPAIKKLDITPQEKELLNKLFDRVSPAVFPGPPAPHKDPVLGTYRITGVVREFLDDDRRSSRGWFDWLNRDAELFLPSATAAKLFGSTPWRKDSGFDRLTVTVEHESQVRAVSKEIDALGLKSFSLADIVERIRSNTLLIAVATALLALVALLVAALGITNTMVMSVLERTHDIGVMKALGARDRDVQALFLLEGTLLGAIGSTLGMLGGWVVSFPGDGIARKLIEQEIEQPVTASVFAYPWWLVTGIPLLVLVITTLAAVYPARRAARVQPIEALRQSA